MKYYSEVTKNLYDSLEECEIAEEKYYTEKREREAKSKEKEIRKQSIQEHINNIMSAIEEYYETYGECDFTFKFPEGVIRHNVPNYDIFSKFFKNFGL